MLKIFLLYYAAALGVGLGGSAMIWGYFRLCQLPPDWRIALPLIIAAIEFPISCWVISRWSRS